MKDIDVLPSSGSENLTRLADALKELGAFLRVGGVARMRDHLAHRYFDTDHEIVTATVEHDLPPLIAAAERLKAAEGT